MTPTPNRVNQPSVARPIPPNGGTQLSSTPTMQDSHCWCATCRWLPQSHDPHRLFFQPRPSH